jgi:hypothetical protein
VDVGLGIGGLMQSSRSAGSDSDIGIPRRKALLSGSNVDRSLLRRGSGLFRRFSPLSIWTSAISRGHERTSTAPWALYR